MENNTFDISVRPTSEDFDTLQKVVNMGIDSRLEGFTKSKFYVGEDERFYFCFDLSELQILLRRLNEIDDENAISLESSILEVQYGFELI